MEKINGKVIPKAAPAGSQKGKAKAVEGEGRPVAVDWALSKDQWEKAKPKSEEKEEESGSSSSSDSDDSDSDSDDSGSDDEDEEGEDEEEDEDGDVTMEAGEDEPVKPTLPTVDVGSTLFIRNLPFEVTEQELNTLLVSDWAIRRVLCLFADSANSDLCDMLGSRSTRLLADREVQDSHASGISKMPTPLSKRPRGWPRRLGQIPCP